MATGRTQERNNSADARKVRHMRITNLIRSLVLSVPLLAIAVPLRATPPAQVGVAVSIRVGPPVLPVYSQPLCPGSGYLWEPGYWAYGVDGYYWVPGIWVLPPQVGLLWTPGYWAFSNGFYAWNAGYWGPTVGFYGGINYGFGYPGSGFYGGHWSRGQYFYNRSVTNVNTTVIHNVYNRTVVNERSANRASFNGTGGVNARPTAAEPSARERRVPMSAAQTQHQREASSDRNMLASVNHGRPDVAASSRPEALSNRSSEPRNGPASSERPRTSNSPGAIPAPARTEHTPTSAPARTEKPAAEKPTHESAPKPAHTEKPAKPARTEKPAAEKPTRESAPHESQPHEQAHATDNKKP